MSKRASPVCPTCGLTDEDDAALGRCDHGPRTTMRNLAMARKLAAGEALDVRAIGHPVAGQPGGARCWHVKVADLLALKQRGALQYLGRGR